MIHRRILFALVMMPNLAIAACEDFSIASFEEIVDASWEALENEDALAYGQTYKRLQQNLQCLQEPMPRELWARFLVGRSLFEFALGENWQDALQTAIDIDPESRPRFGPPPIQEFVAPDRSGEPILAIPDDAEIYLDGARVTEVHATLSGLHIVQRKTESGWETILIRNSPAPEAWVPPPPPAPAEVVMVAPTPSELGTPREPWARRLGRNNSISMVVTGNLNSFAQQYTGGEALGTEVPGLYAEPFSTFSGNQTLDKVPLPVGTRIWGMHGLPGNFRVMWDAQADANGRVGLAAGYQVSVLNILAGAAVVTPAVWRNDTDLTASLSDVDSRNNLVDGEHYTTTTTTLGANVSPALPAATLDVIADIPIGGKSFLELESRLTASSAISGVLVRSTFLRSLASNLMLEAGLQATNESSYLIDTTTDAAGNASIKSTVTSFGGSVGLRLGMVAGTKTSKPNPSDETDATSGSSDGETVTPPSGRDEVTTPSLDKTEPPPSEATRETPPNAPQDVTPTEGTDGAPPKTEDDGADSAPVIDEDEDASTTESTPDNSDSTEATPE